MHLEPTEDLVDEELDVVVVETLDFQNIGEIRAH